MNQKPQISSIKILGGGIGNYPIKLEVVPKRLIVNVYHHDLPGKGSQIPCWIFVTQGMVALKQREIVLVLRFTKDDDGKKFPKTPLPLFMFLFKALLQKKRFVTGDVIRFGEKGLLGFAGMGFTFGNLTARQIQLPPHYLSCVLLTSEELVAAQAFGLTRVLARMGFESNRFPFNPWNDTERHSLPMQAVIKHSQFRNIKALPLKHSSVNLVAGDKVVLLLPVAMHGVISGFIKEQGGANQLAFITQLLPYHEGALVWLPEKDSIEMNVNPDAEGGIIAGSFVLLSRGESSGAIMLEDGFNVQFDQEAWLALRNAIARKQNVVITPSRGDMEFSLLWNTMANPETHSGLNLASLGGQDLVEKPTVEGGWLGKLKRLIRRD
ncbi:TGF-beta receptor interacting domain-containing protein [Kaarinaea lacus]